MMHGWRALCRGAVVLACLWGAWNMAEKTTGAQERADPEARAPKSRADARRWLENMVWHHRYTDAEVAAVFGMTEAEAGQLRREMNITPENRPQRPADAPLRALPYPGGRHPRIGFLDGAVNPQRETKISVFTPWDADSYVVVDVPEAIWSNLGLTYLAHTHVPTVWTQRNVTLERLEWRRKAGGALQMERKLPNGIVFGATVTPEKRAVRMELWLKNGTLATLTDLRVQNCVMLRGAAGFLAQSNDNKLFQAPYAACRSEDGKRWIITAWEPCHRAWGNPPCPCLHSDPKFPDCAPGATQRLRGRLWFYEGEDIQGELKRLDGSGWRGPTAPIATDGGTTE